MLQSVSEDHQEAHDLILIKKLLLCLLCMHAAMGKQGLKQRTNRTGLAIWTKEEAKEMQRLAEREDRFSFLVEK